MNIDYMKNPGAIIKKFIIPYGKPEENLYLEGRIIGHMEDGIDEVVWFTGELRYPPRQRFREKYGCEVGGQRYDPLHQDLKKGAPSIMGAKLKLKRWCDSMGLRISSEEDVTEGVRYERPRRRGSKVAA